jgi:uncharacterized membrane protein YjjP (DUF1212 family)
MAILEQEVLRPSTKPPLDRPALREVIELSLWAGQLLLQYGAETTIIEETIHRFGTGLGCDWMDIFVSPNAVTITATSGDEFRTKTRRVVGIGVNMGVTTAVIDLQMRVGSGDMNRPAVAGELRRISDMGSQYPRGLIVLAVGLSCAAFSRLFEGDTGVFVATFIAAAAAMFVRQELHHRHLNPLLITIITAFVAGLLASAAVWVSPNPERALAAAVLLLVPGVPLINAAEDLIKGHVVTGIVRGVTGTLIVLCIALGLGMAMALTRVGLP